MLYIHKLSDLNMRLAEIESTAFIREIKARMIFPISPHNIYEYLSGCLVSEDDIQSSEKALEELKQAMERISSVLSRKDPVHEPVNLFRTFQMLQQIPEPLEKNIQYLKAVISIQGQLISELAPLLNSIPTLSTREEKAKADAELSAFFEKILRNKEFFFRHKDIIYEAQTSVMNALEESLAKGYFFHVTLEEEMEKANFAKIQFRIPQEKLAEAEEVRQALLRIKQGVEAAYNANMKMVTCAVLLYSCIKWANSRQGY